MQINNFGINTFNIKPMFKGTSTNATQTALTIDKFEHSISKVKSIEYTDAQINKLLDEVYAKVMKHIQLINPDLKGVNFKKPKIEIVTGLDDSNTANYSFTDNTITLQKDSINSDFYLYAKKDSNGNIKEFVDVYTSKQLEEDLPQLNKKNQGFSAIKLTDKEKEAYIKSVIAHELRHFVQGHIVMSTKGCTEEVRNAYIEKQKNILEKKAQIEQLKAEAKELGYEEEIEDIEIPDLSYGISYRPTKMLDTNQSIKYSIFSDDNRKLSIKDHLKTAELNGLNGIGTSDGDYTNYIASPLEVDAYNYEAEFFATQIYDTNSEYREDVLYSIYGVLRNQANRSENAMKSKGINFI